MHIEGKQWSFIPVVRLLIRTLVNGYDVDPDLCCIINHHTSTAQRWHVILSRTPAAGRTNDAAPASTPTPFLQ
jgi:hypothetical protein